MCSNKVDIQMRPQAGGRYSQSQSAIRLTLYQSDRAKFWLIFNKLLIIRGF